MGIFCIYKALLLYKVYLYEYIHSEAITPSQCKVYFENIVLTPHCPRWETHWRSFL